MKIEILGPAILGEQYVKSATQALIKLKIDAEISLISDTDEIYSKNQSLKLPAMFIDGVQKSSGKVLPKSEIIAIIEAIISSKPRGSLRKPRVLFVCIHNSARSQIAEAYMKSLSNGELEVESAGFEPGVLNQLAVDVMAEEGIDISKYSVDSLFSFFTAGKRFNYVITVCDEGVAQKCPIFPGVLKRIHWSFEDPSSFNGSHEDNLAKTRAVRDAIKTKVGDLVDLIRAGKLEENFPADWKLM